MLSLVTGAAGFIGSHAVLSFLGHGYNVIGIDDFSRGFEPISMADFSEKNTRLQRLVVLVFADNSRSIFWCQTNFDSMNDEFEHMKNSPKTRRKMRCQ